MQTLIFAAAIQTQQALSYSPCDEASYFFLSIYPLQCVCTEPARLSSCPVPWQLVSPGFRLFLCATSRSWSSPLDGDG